MTGIALPQGVSNSRRASTTSGRILSSSEGGIVDLLGLEPEMASGQGAFDHDGVGDIPVGFFPGLEYQPGGAARADDRDDPHPGPADRGDRDPLDRQAGAEEEEIDLLFDGGFDEAQETVGGDHDVDAEDARRPGPGLADLRAEGPDIRLERTLIVVGLR